MAWTDSLGPRLGHLVSPSADAQGVQVDALASVLTLRAALSADGLGSFADASGLKAFFTLASSPSADPLGSFADAKDAYLAYFASLSADAQGVHVDALSKVLTALGALTAQFADAHGVHADSLAASFTLAAALSDAQGGHADSLAARYTLAAALADAQGIHADSLAVVRAALSDLLVTLTDTGLSFSDALALVEGLFCAPASDDAGLWTDQRTASLVSLILPGLGVYVSEGRRVVEVGASAAHTTPGGRTVYVSP